MFCFATQAGTWWLLSGGEWWGELFHSDAQGYSLVDVDRIEHPFAAFADFQTLRIVPAPTAAVRDRPTRLALRFTDDRLHYHFWVEQQAMSKDRELFVLWSGGSKLTLVSDRPFIRRTSGKSAAYALRLSEGQHANEAFLAFLLAKLRRLIEMHFEG